MNPVGVVAVAVAVLAAVGLVLNEVSFRVGRRRERLAAFVVDLERPACGPASGIEDEIPPAYRALASRR